MIHSRYKRSKFSNHTPLFKLKPLSLLLTGLVGCGVGSSYSQVNGSRNAPNNITSRAELESITDSGHYQLAKDIDLGGAHWTPLFSSGVGFSGTLLDNGFVLRNLFLPGSGDADRAFIHRLENDSLVSLRFDNATVSVTGSSNETDVALGVNNIAGSGNILTLRANNSRVSALGSALNSVALLANENLGTDNQLNLLDSHSVSISTNADSCNYAALGLAYDNGSCTELFLSKLHDLTLNASAQYIGGALGSQQSAYNSTTLAEEVSGMDILSKYGQGTPHMGLLAGSVFSDNDDGGSTFIARAVAGELSYTGSDNSAKRGLFAGSVQGVHTLQGTILGVGTDNTALIGSDGNDDDCTFTNWDISRNGISQSGCSDDSVGYYSHTAEGWKALWETLEIPHNQKIPGEELINIEGDAQQLITRQTYKNRYSPDGYYDTNGQFQYNQTGPLIFRKLSLTAGNTGVALGEPMAVNLEDSIGGAWQHNQTHLVLVNLDPEQIKWQLLNLKSSELSEIGENSYMGAALAYNSENLFTYDEEQHLIFQYRLDDLTAHQYTPSDDFEADAYFLVGQANDLIQAVINDDGEVTVGPSQANSTYLPATVNFQSQPFQILAQPDPENPEMQQFVLVPENVRLVDNVAVQVEEPDYPWSAFQQNMNLTNATVILSTPVQTAPTTNLKTSTNWETSTSWTSTTDRVSTTNSAEYTATKVEAYPSLLITPSVTLPADTETSGSKSDRSGTIAGAVVGSATLLIIAGVVGTAFGCVVKSSSSKKYKVSPNKLSSVQLIPLTGMVNTLRKQDL